MPNRKFLILGLVIVLCPALAEAKKKSKTNSKEPAALTTQTRQVEATQQSPSIAVAPSTPPTTSTADVSHAIVPTNSDESSRLDDDTSNSFGSDPISIRSNGSLRMLLQLRYRSTFADESGLSSNSVRAEQQRGSVQEQDGYDIQRAFLRYVASPAKNIDVKFLVDFAELKHGSPKQSFKLAYVELHPTRRLQLDFGLLKRPYSLLELLPIAKHELADLGPTDSFIKDQGYGGRDIGAIVRFQPLPDRRMMTVSAGAYRGDIDEGFDASPLKLLGIRIETRPVKHLRLGANAVWRPYDSVEMQKTTDENASGVETVAYKKTVTLRKGAAAGTDATLTFRHLEVRAEMLLGKRTDPKQLAFGRQGSFWAAWVVVAPKIEVGKWLLVPALKAEVLDTDALNPSGQRRSLTGVFGLVPMNGLRIIADVTRSWNDSNVQSLDPVPWTSGSNTVYVTEPNWTSATIQAQVMF